MNPDWNELTSVMSMAIISLDLDWTGQCFVFVAVIRLD